MNGRISTVILINRVSKVPEGLIDDEQKDLGPRGNGVWGMFNKILTLKQLDVTWAVVYK